MNIINQMFAATPMYIIYYKEILILTTILTYSMYVYITKALHINPMMSISYKGMGLL